MPVTDLAKQAVNFCKGLPDLGKQAISFWKENDLPTIYQAFKSTDAHPLVQFIKYGICGGIAFATSIAIWLLLAYTIFPCVDGMVIDGETISDELRAKNFTIANIVAWFIANLVAYVTNVLWVFKVGRHSRWVEFLLFTLASGLATACGIALGHWLITGFGLHSFIAQFANVVMAVLINYTARKFFVFNG